MDKSLRAARIPNSARRGVWRLWLAVTLGAGAATLAASPAPAQSARPAPSPAPASAPPAAASSPAVPPAVYPYPVNTFPPGFYPRPASSALPPGAYTDFYPAPPASAPRPSPAPAASAAPPGAYPYPYPYPYPYGYPARPVVVPPAAPLPDEMDDEGQPVPDGYRRVRRPQRMTMLVGASLFGGLYVYSVNVALSSDNTSDRWLLVPVFGPLLDAHDRSNNCTAPCPRQGLMTVDFSLQTAGFGLLLAALINPRPMIVKDPKEPPAISWSVTPAAGPSLRGMLATGSF